ncbi:MAG: TIGR00645 family protein [Pseudomonadota bacterium]
MSAKFIENIIERGLFASRWVMAPFYIGLALALVALLYNFIIELWHFFNAIELISSHEVMLTILSLIDLSLTGNLMLIVIFSGYENFVSRFDIEENNNPDWKITVDFATLKLKLISSIVAISCIHLLKIFMSDNVDVKVLKLKLITLMVFVVSGLLLACMDFISTKTKNLKK